MWHLEANQGFKLLASSLMRHSHSPFHLFFCIDLTSKHHQKIEGKMFLCYPIMWSAEKTFCSVILAKGNWPWSIWKKLTKKSTHKWHRLYMAIIIHPVLSVVAGFSKAKLVGLKCEKDGPGHSPWNELLLQLKLRLCRKRVPLCQINECLIPLLWSQKFFLWYPLPF